MFSKTRTNCMYSNSAAQTHGARVQSKHEEFLRLNTYSSFASFFIYFKPCDNVIRVTNIFPKS